MSSTMSNPNASGRDPLQSGLAILTGLLLASLLVYVAGWVFNKWIGNFSLLLFLMSAITFLFWLGEVFRFKPQREAAAAALVREDLERRERLKAQGIDRVDGDVEKARQALLRQPWWLDWTAGLFPVILLVFVLRSFLFEPFRIPSGSMIPTLHIGDLILVNKFHYGVRLPVINKKIISNHEVQRGDVMVFRFPLDPRQDYIKRIVGLPGDEVRWSNQRLSINGVEVPTTDQGPQYEPDRMIMVPQYLEKLGVAEHTMMVDRSQDRILASKPSFAFSEQCSYTLEAITCKVPAGHYYAMGDNRDNSGDSRQWGFVPDQNIVGKAVFIWMNFSQPSRIGSFR
jgi:signal peptidase I